jgi:hypothetical protein
MYCRKAAPTNSEVSSMLSSPCACALLNPCAQGCGGCGGGEEVGVLDEGPAHRLEFEVGVWVGGGREFVRIETPEQGQEKTRHATRKQSELALDNEAQVFVDSVEKRLKQKKNSRAGNKQARKMTLRQLKWQHFLAASKQVRFGQTQYHPPLAEKNCDSSGEGGSGVGGAGARAGAGAGVEVSKKRKGGEGEREGAREGARAGDNNGDEDSTEGITGEVTMRLSLYDRLTCHAVMLCAWFLLAAYPPPVLSGSSGIAEVDDVRNDLLRGAGHGRRRASSVHTPCRAFELDGTEDSGMGC